MAQKRARDELTPPATPNRSRKRRFASLSSSPVRGYGSTPTSSYSVSSTFGYSYSVPSDSPTNPFGLDTLRDVFLPMDSSFSKHASLRFQVVCPDDFLQPDESAAARRRAQIFKGKGRATELPAWRVVQVPLNYSFRLLHALILFLFGTSAPAPAFPLTRLSRAPPSSSCEIPPCTSTHRFETWTEIYFEGTGARAGIIQRGHMRYVLSEDSESWDPSPLDPTDTPAGTLQAVEHKDAEHSKLRLVWPKGPNINEAIIYWPDPEGQPELAVHITPNLLPVTARTGHGNTPFVFLAGGAVPPALAQLLGPPPPPLPVRPPDSDAPPPPRPRKARTASAAGPAATPATDAHACWNAAGVFDAFVHAGNARARLALRRRAGSAGSPSPGDLDDFDDDGDDNLEVPFASSPVRPDDLGILPAPARRASSSARSDRDVPYGGAHSDDEDDDLLLLTRTSPRARSLSADWFADRVPLITPAPALAPRAARRLGAEGRRIAGLTHRLMERYERADAQEEAELEAPEDAQDEVDELADDPGENPALQEKARDAEERGAGTPDEESELEEKVERGRSPGKRRVVAVDEPEERGRSPVKRRAGRPLFKRAASVEV